MFELLGLAGTLLAPMAFVVIVSLMMEDDEDE